MDVNSSEGVIVATVDSNKIKDSNGSCETATTVPPDKIQFRVHKKHQTTQ